MLECFWPSERPRLGRLLRSTAWRAVLEDEAFIRWCRETRLPAASPPSQLRGVPAYLIRANGDRVSAMVASGLRDRAKLVEALGDWRTALQDDPRHPLLYLGLTVTTRCSFRPRCLYCNQIAVNDELTMERFKELIAEAASPQPPYVYITGGEPLLLGELVWGADGLAAFAASLGCAVNINTNAALLTPRIAMHLVRSGVSRLHVSLDSSDRAVQAVLFGGAGRVAAVWQGIRNIMLAREIIGSDHPRIHINCVVTNRNMEQVPDTLQALWSLRRLTDGASSLDDFAFHLIPIGGSSNAALRPTAAQWLRFYSEIWDQADRAWHAEQTRRGLSAQEQRPLAEVVPFANPYLRVDHRMSLREYSELAATGVYWQGALCERCWVAPSQACVLPDGAQHWCGGHAIRRPAPMGDAASQGLRENIRRSLPRLEELPGPHCVGCAGATCAINQATRSALYGHIAALLDA